MICLSEEQLNSLGKEALVMSTVVSNYRRHCLVRNWRMSVSLKIKTTSSSMDLSVSGKHTWQSPQALVPV